MKLVQQCVVGQAQLGVGGEAVNNSRKALSKIFGPTVAIFSSQEALSFHFSFKLEITITLLS